MSKLKQILLTKQLVVNLGKDEDGQQKTITLPMGLQEVDAEVADHWFVKAHAQEITAGASANKELQDAFDALKAQHEALLTQSDAATAKISELELKAVADAKTIDDLSQQLNAALKAQHEAKSDPKAK